MVHRIQNRNPGYSDFSHLGTSASFNFSSTAASPISNGANALKLENEIVQEQANDSNHANIVNEEIMTNSNHVSENVVEDSSINEMEKSFTQEAIETSQENKEIETIEDDISNDLKEFGVDSDSPDLFSSESEHSTAEDLLSSNEEEDDDDLEIPAFLRRQKN